MGEWILLRSEAELETKAKVLRKRCRGHYYTNYYFINSTRDNDLRYTEMFYREDGDNLYAIERKDDFYQLFYFAGDVDSIRLDFPTSVEHSVLTCEIDEEEGKEKQGPVLEKLYAEGFSDYKNYHFYDRRGGEFRRFHLDGFDLSYQASPEELSVMYDIFDPYSDNLPLRKAFPEYLKSMSIVSGAVNGKYAGSYIFSPSGWRPGYVFSCGIFSGTGKCVTSAMLDQLAREHPDRIARSTIEDNNIKSIHLHMGFGYKRTNQYHKILIRRP